MARGLRFASELQLRAVERRIREGGKTAPEQVAQPSGPRPATTEQVIGFSLPWPPTSNNLYPTGSDGKRHPSRQAMSFRDSASAIVRVEMMRQRFAALAGPVFVSILLIPPDGRKYDIDNRCKALIDSLEAGGLFANDAQVQHLEVRNLGPMRPGEGVANVTVRAIVEEVA
jgi:crossover junction endodeoxyribonuclease RusA